MNNFSTCPKEFCAFIYSNNKTFGEGVYDGNFRLHSSKISRILLIYDGKRERLILKNEEKENNFIILSMKSKKLSEGTWNIGFWFVGGCKNGDYFRILDD